ncbi:MAG: coenzyme F420-0:L-glutamate ligase [Gammaproteobacteria bacterium]|nr:coenzyme F420-0:L-glutamate ligase [Gammaproteobacteria bacterium]MBT8444588.1 coenzyme F420-0:L-glutamate ligase [Gammaproteobacteria bacterium]NND36234.1 coenzyme F420-0:L-glutamate ligase [Gammaproteobacteria bacterium]
MTSPSLSFIAVPGIPEVRPGADLPQLLVDCLHAAGLELADGDILAVAQKIISKAENRLVDLNGVEPSPRALSLAYAGGKDPRLAELILRESKRIVRDTPTVIIVEHRSGIVLANAGIDRSNVAGDDDTVLLLPEDADASAAGLKQRLDEHYGASIGVLITDSVGRPWRLGTTGIAIGCAGIEAMNDMRGDSDRFGRVLQVAEVATADCLAGAAGLVMGEGDEGVPVVVVRGAGAGTADQTARDILRPADEDLFQ